MPVDEIYIKDLVITGRHGVTREEKAKPQKFKVSVHLNVDNQAAASSDNLDDTIDWSKLHKIIKSTVEDNSFNLMERLAEEVANVLLNYDGRIDKVIVSLDKLQAFNSGIPGVRLKRQRA
jgi:dihydroneopterin aldolase